MTIKSFHIDTPEQLRSLYLLRPEGNESIDNLVRVWRAHCALASANNTNPMPTGYACKDFDTKKRTVTAYKSIHGHEAIIGHLPYNKALAICRDLNFTTLPREVDCQSPK